MTRVLALTTIRDVGKLNGLRDQGFCVIPLRLDSQLLHAIDSLDRALSRYPPVNLSLARLTWLPLAGDLANVLAIQAARAGECLKWDKCPERFSHIFVIAEKVIPVDLIPCQDSLLGIECVVAHAVAGNEDVAFSVLESEKLPLRRIAHVCSYDPGSTSLHEMDVVSATLRLVNTMAIEHYFYPTAEVARGLFQRSDIDILHFECHGTAGTLQIDNPFGVPVSVCGLHSSSGPNVYFFLGCNSGADMNSVAPTFVKQGARASVGAYCEFLSGGNSGEVSTSAFYDALYQGLVAGVSLGESVRAGRKAAAPDRIYYCAWLLFGNPHVAFSVQKFGGTAPNLRLHRTAGFAASR